jgi:hypothetical protein
MHTLKTSRKRSIKHDVAEFEIVGIEVKGVPSVRVSNQPVQKPPPSPTPTPEPPPPPSD